MPKTKAQKEVAVTSLVEDLAKAKSVVFTNFTGLKVKEVVELRKKCRDEQMHYVVAKKTLMNRAFKTAKLDVDAKQFPGEVATVLSFGDEVAPARVLVGYAKEHPALKPFGGILESRYVDAGTIQALAALPSKQELIAKVVGSIGAPLSGLVRVLAGNLRGLVQVLTARVEKG